MKHMVTLDYKLMLSLWQYNHHPDEGLTSGLFQKTFGPVDGKHYYEKWTGYFNRNLWDMIAYFRGEGENGQKFCDMIAAQVELYTKNRRGTAVPARCTANTTTGSGTAPRTVKRKTAAGFRTAATRRPDADVPAATVRTTRTVCGTAARISAAGAGRAALLLSATHTGRTAAGTGTAGCRNGTRIPYTATGHA